MANGTPSEPAAADLATTVMFDPLISRVSELDAAHVVQLRTAVAAVRATAGLSPAVFAEAVMKGVTVKAEHLQELRTALNDARVAIGLAAVVYSQPSPLKNLVISKADVEEIRGGVR